MTHSRSSSHTDTNDEIKKNPSLGESSSLPNSTDSDSEESENINNKKIETTAAPAPTPSATPATSPLSGSPIINHPLAQHADSFSASDSEEPAEPTAGKSTPPKIREDKTPFDIINDHFAQGELPPNAEYRNRLEHAKDFADILLSIKINADNPATAVAAVKKKVNDLQEAHLEHISSINTYFYNQIAVLNKLNEDTIITQYNAFMAKTQMQKEDLHCFIQNHVTHHDNLFSKLHVYLLTKNTFEKNADKQQRKFNDFIKLLAVERPDPEGSSFKSSNDQSDDEFAANGVICREARDYQNDIKAITKPYNGSLLTRFTGYSGEFKDLMQAIRNAKVEDLINQHQVYLANLGSQKEVSAFAKIVNDTLNPSNPAHEDKKQSTRRSSTSLSTSS